jgi:hypothetical protein
MNNPFYVLDIINNQNHRLFAGGQYINDIHRCPSCGTFLDINGKQKRNEIEIDHLGKLGFSVYLWNSYSLPLFRTDLIEAWQASDITGYITEAVEIIGWHGKHQKPLPSNIPEYRRIMPTSLVELIEPIRTTKSCPACGFVHYGFPEVGTYLPRGIHINMVSWNGSDINKLIGYNYIFCTKKVAQVTLASGFGRYIGFVKVENWGKWEEYDIKKWNPSEYQSYLNSFVIRNIEELEKQ